MATVDILSLYIICRGYLIGFLETLQHFICIIKYYRFTETNWEDTKKGNPLGVAFVYLVE